MQAISAGDKLLQIARYSAAVDASEVLDYMRWVSQHTSVRKHVEVRNANHAHTWSTVSHELRCHLDIACVERVLPLTCGYLVEVHVNQPVNWSYN